DKPPLHIGEGDDHGIDFAGRDGLLQLLKTQVARHSFLPFMRDLAPHETTILLRAEAGKEACTRASVLPLCHDTRRLASRMASSRISRARIICSSVVMSGGVSVRTLPMVVLN